MSMDESLWSWYHAFWWRIILVPSAQCFFDRLVLAVGLMAVHRRRDIRVQYQLLGLGKLRPPSINCPTRLVHVYFCRSPILRATPILGNLKWTCAAGIPSGYYGLVRGRVVACYSTWSLRSWWCRNSWASTVSWLTALDLFKQETWSLSFPLTGGSRFSKG